MRLFGILSSYCWSSAVSLGRLVGVGLAVVNLEASGKAIIFGEWCLRRDVEGTWRGRGSEKGLVVMRLTDGEGSYCGELFRVRCWGVGKGFIDGIS